MLGKISLLFHTCITTGLPAPKWIISLSTALQRKTPHVCLPSKQELSFLYEYKARSFAALYVKTVVIYLQMFFIAHIILFSLFH
jgi:hypothetical protein